MREYGNPVDVSAFSPSLSLSRKREANAGLRCIARNKQIYIYEPICAIADGVIIGKGENSSVVTVIRARKFTSEEREGDSDKSTERWRSFGPIGCNWARRDQRRRNKRAQAVSDFVGEYADRDIHPACH